MIKNIIFYGILLISTFFFIISSIDYMDKLGNIVENLLRLKKSKPTLANNSKIKIKPIIVLYMKERFLIFLKANSLKRFGYSVFGLTFSILILFPEAITNFFGELLGSIIITCVFIMLICVLSKQATLAIKSKFLGKFFASAIWTLAMFIYLGIAYFQMILAKLEKGNNISFYLIILSILLLFIPLLSFAKACIDINSKISGIIIIIMIFIFFEASMYMFFGIYNISTDINIQKVHGELLQKINQIPDVKSILTIMHIGSKHVFEYPDFNNRLEYFIQYIIGFISHVIIVGFFISYFSSKALTDNNSSEDKKFKAKDYVE